MTRVITPIENLDVTISRVGNIVEIGGPNGSPLDPTLLHELRRVFSYTLRKRLPGWRTEYEYINMDMFFVTATGTLIGAYGLVNELVRWLIKHKCRVQALDKTPKDKNYVKLQPQWESVSNNQFRPRQMECLKAIVEKNHGIINAPVGFGKTYLLGQLTRIYPTSKFHICTKSVDIAKSIYNSLLKITPNVGMIGGGNDESDKRITVITADSLEKSDGDAAFFIYDECHQAAAPTYAHNITKIYKYSRCYGFSATPKGRSDGTDRVLTQLFGDVIFEMGYNEAKDLGLVVPIHVRWLVCDDVPRGALSYATEVSQRRHAIWANERRNQLIVDDIKENYSDPDKQVLILVHTIEQAVNLGAMLPEYTLVYGNMSPTDKEEYVRKGLLPEDHVILKSKAREQLKQDFRDGRLKKVISTDVWNTGVDFPSLQVVYNATARKSSILTTQGAGRVSRLSFGKDGGTVVDIVDRLNQIPNPFYNAAKSRYKTYSNLGWEQTGFKGMYG